MFRFLLSAGLLASSMGTAQAAPKCPPGEIYRITKKVCVDKATAIRDGVLRFREKAKNRTASNGVLSKNKIASNTTPDSTYPSARPATEISGLAEDVSALSWASIQALDGNPSAPASRSSASANLLPLETNTSDAASPFGALSNPWTSTVTSASPSSRFPLQFATGD